MKIYLTGEDEWYPMYDFREPSHPYYGVSGIEVEVDTRIVERWLKTRDAFWKMHAEIEKLTKAVEGLESIE